MQKFYVGSTHELDNRLNEHNSGEGNFTSKGIPWKIIHVVEVETRSEAMKLENQIKKRGIRRFLMDQGIEFNK